MPRTVTFTPRTWLRKIWQLGTFDVSPDGRLLAYGANKGEQWTVYVRDLESGREKTLVRSEQATMNPEFSPDGGWVAVQADLEGDENFDVYVVPARGGEPRRLTEHAMDDAFPRWSPDGRSIAFISNRDRDRENVFVVDAAGGEPTQLTTTDDIVNEIAWRPDGRSIAFMAGVGDRDWVGLVDLAGRAERLVADANAEAAIAGDAGRPRPWSPDGRELAFVSNVHNRLDIGALDLETRAVRWLARGRHDTSMPVWSPDGERVAYLENRDGDVQLRTVGRDGRGARAVSPATGVATRPLWAPDGRSVFYIHSSSREPPRILTQRGARRTTLLGAAQGDLPREELAGARLVRYRTFDGRRVPAWLYMPPRARYRGALLVEPHGGPESQVLNEWDAGAQFFVAEGFAVLYPNFRGGTGYGRAWRRLSDRDLGGDDIRDVIEAGRWALRKRLCAPDRLGIIGTSYGGYAVAHSLERAPDLWAAGVSIVGFFDWLTATTTERGYLQKYDRWKMGDPTKDEAFLRSMSPIHSVDKIRAPVLFTGGANDPRCPVTEARQMVDRMKSAGKVVDYLEFPDEGHWPRKMSNQIRLYERALAWMKEHLPDAAATRRTAGR